LDKRSRGNAASVSASSSGGDYTGWIPVTGAVSYNSVDDPTGVINVQPEHGVGIKNRLKLLNGGHTIYGIVTAVTTTTITFLHEIDPTDSLALYLLSAGDITDVYYSRDPMPQGFPNEPTKWTVWASKTTSPSQAVLSPSTLDVWQRAGSISLAVPIGAWKIQGKFDAQVVVNGSTYAWGNASISSSTSTETNKKLTHTMFFDDGNSSNKNFIDGYAAEDDIVLTSKTPFYIIMKTLGTAATVLQANYISGIYMWATCAYL
jgi:hypothetical protein